MKRILKLKINHLEEEYVNLINHIKTRTCNFDNFNAEYFCFEEDKSYNELIKGILSKSITQSKSNEFKFKKDDTKLLIEIVVNEQLDEEDIVFSFKFLSILRRVDKEINPFIYLNCSNVFYSKMASYLFFDSVCEIDWNNDVKMDAMGNAFICDSDNYYSHLLVENNGKVARMPLTFNHSREWLSIIPIISRNIAEKNNFIDEVFNVLRQPLFDYEILKDKFEKIKSFKKGAHKDNFLSYIYQNVANEKNYTKGEALKYYLLKVIENNLNNIDIFDDEKYRLIIEAPSLALLLFSLMTKVINNNTINKANYVNCCLDYCDGILQLIENASAYSNVGVISIRANDSQSKLISKYNFNIQNKWFFRISVTDTSNSTIVNNIIKKVSDSGCTVENLSLNDVFFNTENREYNNYLKMKDNLVHHYGLSTFSHLVDQNGGLFLAISSQNTQISIDQKEYVIKYSANDYGIKPSENEFSINKYCHFGGTSYEILLPFKAIDKDKIVPPSISFYDIDYTKKYIEKKVTSSFGEKTVGFFNKQLLDSVFKNNKVDDYQKWKEKCVSEYSKILLSQLESEENKRLSSDTSYIFTFDLSDAGGFYRVEIIGKIIMSIIANSAKGIKLALYGMRENEFVSMIRQFALFYDKLGQNEYMKNCQIYFCSNNSKSEALLLGENINSLMHYLMLMKLNSVVSNRTTDFLEHLAGRNASQDISNEAIVPFEDIITLNSKKKYLWLNKLDAVLQSDIHKRNLGCKLSNTHVKISNAHLSDFYEAQFLFGNNYWVRKFSQFIADKVGEKEKNEDTKIVLIGYETYSESMIFHVKIILEARGYKSVTYGIFENEKYVTKEDKSVENIRYIDEISKHSKEENSQSVFYIVGISSTLSNFDKMDDCLKKKLNDENFKKKYCLSLIQVYDNNNNELVTIENNEAKSKYLKNAASDKKSEFLIGVLSNWNSALKCKLCFPENNCYLEEKPVVSVDEASVIPMLLIKPDQENSKKEDTDKVICPNSYCGDFFTEKDNTKYIYYGHIDRGDNHYQYYIKTAMFLQDKLKQKGGDVYLWFEYIKESLKQYIKRKSINILVAPSHFSNETFIVAINEYVFGGNGYIINFDIKKEFRSNIDVKYSNYKDMMETLTKMPEKERPQINFFYIDDQIMSGGTFARAKSLAKSLIGNYKSNEISIFKAIFVLVDRNSLSTKRGYIDSVKVDDASFLPYYSFLKMNIPALRSYGDSCPICKKHIVSEALMKSSYLNCMDFYWREKSYYHKVKSIEKIRQEYFADDTNLSDKNKKILEKKLTRQYIRIQCEEQIWKILKENDNAECIDQKIFEFIKDIKESKQLEYLISFIKIASRPVLVYQEGLKTAIFSLMLKLFDTITYKTKHKSPICKLIKNKIKTEIYKEKLIDLYKIIIARLCDNKSKFLLSKNDCGRIRLVDCFEFAISISRNEDLKKLEIFFIASVKNMLSGVDNEIKVDFLNNLQNIIKEKDEPIYKYLYLEIKPETLGKFVVDNEQNLSNKNSFENMYDSLNNTAIKHKCVKEIQLFTLSKDTMKNLNSASFDIQFCNKELLLNKIGYLDQPFNNLRYIWIQIDNNYTEMNSIFKDEYNDYAKQNLFAQEIKPLFLRLEIQKDANEIDVLDAASNLLSLRKHFLYTACNALRNDAYELMIYNEEKKKALSISKAGSHSIGPYYNKIEFSKLIKQDSGALSNRIMQHIANDFISKLYRSLILDGCNKRFTKNRKIAQAIGIEEDDIYIKLFNGYKMDFPIVDSNKTAQITIKLDKISLKNTYFSMPCIQGFNSQPLYICLLMAGNVALHSLGTKKNTSRLNVEYKDEYLIFSNKLVDEKSAINAVKSAKQKISALPWETADKQDNISLTLWTINKYFQILNSDEKTECPTDTMIIESIQNNFIIKLKIKKYNIEE